MKPRTPPKPGIPQVAKSAAGEEAAAAAGTRKKALGVRVWILVDSKGEAQQVEAGKHAIMKHTGLPARDLRILDPLLSYPSTILGRERAIVVNLEHIKAIITAQEVFLLNPKAPGVAPLITDLQRRLPNLYDGFGQQQVPAGVDGGFSFFAVDADNQMPSTSPSKQMMKGSSLDTPPNLTIETDLKNMESGMGPKILPFEFRALEVCLEAACSCLEAETSKLEQEAYPALDELTSKISTLNLERVRQIKSKLVAISGRVQKVRDELEQLLDDDGDMAEMYLTDKLLGQLNEPSFTDGLDEPVNHPENDRVESDEESERPLGDVSRDRLDTFQMMFDETGRQDSIAVSRHDSDKIISRSSSSSSRNSAPKHSDVEELEMLLEAYFVQIDGTLNKLSALREYVDDTEDYINIMLDDKQNHLLQMGVMLTTATLVLSGFIVVTGIFGMNIHISLFDTGTLKQFLLVVVGCAAASMFLYIMVISWCRWKGLLE